MKAKPIFVSLIALIALVAVVAAAGSSLNVYISNVEVGDVDVSGNLHGGTTTVAAMNDGTLPVEVTFTSSADTSDVRVKVWISGFRSDLEAETFRFGLLNGSTYHKELTVKLPSDIDLSEDYTLNVRIESKTDFKEVRFPIRVQRESYDVRILSADFDRTAIAGDILAIDVVIKNRGFNRLDDNFVRVRIPELGVEKKVYFGDLTPLDDEEDEDKEDAVLGRLYVAIPSGAETGIYNVEVETFNSDSSDKVTETLAVSSSAAGTRALAPVMTKEVSRNSEASYDLILVNSGKSIAVYELSAETVEGLSVRVDEPIVTVSAGSSRTVKVTVTPTSSGTKSFAVNVYKDGRLVERVPLTADVTGAGISGNSAVILTVVLAIVFIVLLVVLIVLLTRKPAKATEESFGESYY